MDYTPYLNLDDTAVEVVQHSGPAADQEPQSSTTTTGYATASLDTELRSPVGLVHELVQSLTRDTESAEKATPTAHATDNSNILGGEHNIASTSPATVSDNSAAGEARADILHNVTTLIPSISEIQILPLLPRQPEGVLEKLGETLKGHDSVPPQHNGGILNKITGNADVVHVMEGSVSLHLDKPVAASNLLDHEQKEPRSINSSLSSDEATENEKVLNKTPIFQEQVSNVGSLPENEVAFDETKDVHIVDAIRREYRSATGHDLFQK